MREKDEGTFRAGPGVRGSKRGRVWNKGTKTLICSRSKLGSTSTMCMYTGYLCWLQTCKALL